MTSQKLKAHLSTISHSAKHTSECVFYYFADCDSSNGWINKTLSEILSAFKLQISHVHRASPNEYFFRCNLKGNVAVTFIAYGAEARNLYVHFCEKRNLGSVEK